MPLSPKGLDGGGVDSMVRRCFQEVFCRTNGGVLAVEGMPPCGVSGVSDQTYLASRVPRINKNGKPVRQRANS